MFLTEIHPGVCSKLLCSTTVLEERQRLNRSAGRPAFHHCCLQGIC